VKQINSGAVFDNIVVVGKEISTSILVTVTVFAGTSSPEDMCHFPFLKSFRYLICNVAHLIICSSLLLLKNTGQFEQKVRHRA